MKELAIGATLLILSGLFLIHGAKRVSAKAEMKLEPVPHQVSQDTPESRQSKVEKPQRRVRIATRDIRLDRGFDWWEPHIRYCESRGDWTADNPTSSASGAYGVLDSTWSGHGGYARAKDAPPEIQREKAKLLFDKSGLRPWFADSRAKRCILGRAS